MIGKSEFSSRLRTVLQLTFPTPSKTERPPQERTKYREQFKNYLFVLHSIIRASVPLMLEAERRCLQPDNDQLRSSLAKYYHKHAKEETDHDRWLLADLEVIGVPDSGVLSRKPVEAVAELVGSQYYWIHHWHPVCLMGYIAVLEGYPPQRKDIQRLIAKTGYPEAAFRTLAKHSYLDPHHREALNATLDGLPLNHRHEEWITLNAIYTLRKWKEIVSSS
jgi:hypothetical protein